MRRPFAKILSIILPLAAVLFAIPQAADAALLDIGLGVIQKLFTWPIEYLVLPLAATVMWLAGTIMDAAINFGLHTAYIFSLSPAVNLGWVIVRDLANLFFIFILIWISLNTIVKGTGYGTKDLLTKVIIAAILINFSLFFTKSIIDVSNVFGNWLYGGVQNTLQANTVAGSKGSVSLSGLIATRMGIIGFWDATGNAGTAQTVTEKLTDPTKNFISVYLRLAVVLVTTYIFLYVSVLFIARSITLLFLLVFSPIMFMGKVLPQIEEYSKKWWKELSNAAIFPVAFLLMLYISLQFINSLGMLDLKTLQDKSIDALGGISVSVYFQYFIIIFLLQATLKIAKEHSGSVGDMLGGFAKQLAQLGVSAAGGGAAFLGKMAIGGTAARFANSTGLNQAVASGGMKGFIAGSLQNRLSKVSDFHFDPKAGIGLDIKGGKGGYKTMIEDRLKQQEKAQKALAPKSEETKAAKDDLEKAEMRAYGKHVEYGGMYSRRYGEFKALDAKVKSGRGSQTDIKERDKARKDLDKLKSGIDQDEGFKIDKKIFEEQTELLKSISESLKEAQRSGDTDRIRSEEKKLASVEAAMRQEKAVQSFESDLGTKFAEAISKPLEEQTAATKAMTAAATILTGGLARPLAKQYAADNKKIAGKMRDAMKEGDKKKKQQDISKLLVELAEGEAEGGGAAKPEAGAPAAGEEKEPK